MVILLLLILLLPQAPPAAGQGLRPADPRPLAPSPPAVGLQKFAPG